jgi:hypothetical protein
MMLEAYNDIASVLPRVDRLKVACGDDADFHRVLALIYSDIIEFNQRVYKFFRRRAWHFWFPGEWALFERRFKTIVARLASHCDLMDREAAAIHFAEMKKKAEDDRLNHDELERWRRDSMAKDLFGRLSPGEDGQEEFLHRIADEREPRTCNWILKETEIISWIGEDDANTVLWLTGIPGAGKSYLCSAVIQYLMSQTSHTTLYYFCGQTSSEGGSCCQLLCTLAVQILRRNLDMAPLVHQMYLQRGWSLSTLTLKKLLKDVLPSIGSTRIVVDGVDEWRIATQQDVLNALLELQKHSGTHCKILLSSRREPLIEKAMQRATPIPLEGKTTDAIGIYIEKKLNELRESFPDAPPALFDKVQQSMEKKAEGMFLWVRLVTAMLEQQLFADLEAAIDALPDGLDEAYGRILERIRTLKSPLKERIFRILFWVCAKLRPVSIYEVADGLSLKPGRTTLNKENKIRDIKRNILELCAPIVETRDRGIIDVVHFSAKEYLLNEQSGPFIDIAQAHLDIAFSCVSNLKSAFILVPRLSGGVNDLQIDNLIVQGCFGLQKYGHQFWAEHVLAYLEKITVLGDRSMPLTDALQLFSRIRKDSSAQHESYAGNIPTILSRDLQKLSGFPVILLFIKDWLLFKSELAKTWQSQDSIEEQQQWQLQKDTTYLSLIDFSLRDRIETLLARSPSDIPSHLDKADFIDFLNRFKTGGFLCRSKGCSQQFDSCEDRDSHEFSHTPSFPCLKCEFSGRGFRSRRDLEQHTRRYHMTEEDFEIPSSLENAGARLSKTYDPSGSYRQRQSWNEEGRRVMQQSFLRGLATFESKVVSTVRSSHPPGSPWFLDKASVNSNLNQPPESGAYIDLDKIRQKIEGHQYQTVTELKGDLRSAWRKSESKITADEFGECETLFDRELEKAMTEFPAFSSLGLSQQKTNRCNASLERPGDSGNVCVAQTETGKSNTQAEDSIPGILKQKGSYWSSTEENELPRLLKLCGRNFSKISEYLMTKSAIDVEQHFQDLVSSGREDLSQLVAAAEIKIRTEKDRSLDGITVNLDPTGELAMTMPPHQELGYAVAHDMRSYSSSLREMQLQNSSLRTFTPSIGSEAAENSVAPTSSLEESSEPKRYKRRPPPKAFCPHCTRYPDGLHNDNALAKHISRFHLPMRRVWRCRDVSINKDFLANCKLCRRNKRYSFKKAAVDHLRQKHFTASTPVEKLQKWVMEVEEPNPQYQANAMSLNSIQETAALPGPRRLQESWNSEEIPTSSGANPHDGNAEGSDSRGPELGSREASLHASEEEEMTLESGTPGVGSFGEVILSNVSFDNILPGCPNDLQTNTTSASGDRPAEIAPHLANRGLIRVYQVDRLPHLTSFQKEACKDHVEALHEILDKDPVGSKTYNEALESLVSLSRTLLKDLRDWRQLSTFAPQLPVSF